MGFSFWMGSFSSPTTSRAARPTTAHPRFRCGSRQMPADRKERMHEMSSACQITAALPPSGKRQKQWVCESSTKSKLQRIKPRSHCRAQANHLRKPLRSLQELVLGFLHRFLHQMYDISMHIQGWKKKIQQPLTALFSATLFQRLTKITYFIANFAIWNPCTSSLLDFYYR